MNVSIQEILTQAFAFAILLFILKRLAWKPILELLDSRRNKIASEFSEIEQTKKALDQLKVDYEQKLAHIQEEMRAKLADAIQEGKKLSREIQETARGEAKEILDKAKEDIALEAAKAQVTLRKEMAGLVFQATEHLIHEKVTNQKDEEMILRFIKELEDSKERVTKS